MKRFITPGLTSAIFWLSSVIIVVAVITSEVIILGQIRSGVHGSEVVAVWSIFAVVPFVGALLIILSRIAAESITIVFRIERHLRVVSQFAAMSLKQAQPQEQSRRTQAAPPRIEPRL